MANLDDFVLPLFIVDAFSKRAFSGNGAAVCLLPPQQVIPNDVKQKIAAEMNLSETAFISIIKETDTFQNGSRFGLQWFTPKCEVPLCGHATLASSAVLFYLYNNQSPILEFETASGILKAKQLSEDKIEIDLPMYELKHVDFTEYEGVIKAAVGSLPAEEVTLCSLGMLMIRLNDSITRHQLQELKPQDAELLAGVSKLMGVIVTVKASGLDDCLDDEGNSYDFLSRFFAPWCGVSEDPVCGSAHCVLGPYWSKVLKKTELYARQCSSRGGDLHITICSDRVAISGNAVVVKGQINF